MGQDISSNGIDLGKPVVARERLRIIPETQWRADSDYKWIKEWGELYSTLISPQRCRHFNLHTERSEVILIKFEATMRCILLLNDT